MLKRRNQKKPFKVLDLEPREEVGDDVITPYEALRSCIYSFVKEEGLTYYYDKSHRIFNVQGVGEEVTFNYGPEYFETDYVSIDGVGHDYKNIIEIRSPSSNFSMDITFSIYSQLGPGPSMINFITGPQQMTYNQYQTLRETIENPNMYNYNGLDDLFRKDIGSASNNLRAWVLRYFHFLISAIQMLYINTHYYSITNIQDIINIGNNEYFKNMYHSVTQKNFQNVLYYIERYTVYETNFYLEQAAKELEPAINQFLFTTEYYNGEFIYNHHFKFELESILPRCVYQESQNSCSVTIPELFRYLGKIGNWVNPEFYIDNFGNITVHNINEAGPCMFYVTQINYTNAHSGIYERLEYRRPSEIDTIFMVISSLNNPTMLNGKKLINWRVKQAYIRKDMTNFPHDEIYDKGNKILEMLNSNILTVKWLWKEPSTLYNLTEYINEVYPGITGMESVEPKVNALMEYFRLSETAPGVTNGINKCYAIFQEGNPCLRIFEELTMALKGTRYENNEIFDYTGYYDIDGQVWYNPYSLSMYAQNKRTCYKPLNLKTVFDWNSHMKDFVLKGKVYFSREDNDLNIDNWLKDLLSRAGYSVSEVVNFVGYKKPSVSSDDTVSSSRDSEIIEYGQMMSLLQEERNAIQSGKIREGYPSNNLWVVGVMQDKRGTYLEIFRNESSNDSNVQEFVEVVSETENGEVIRWSKAYRGEPLDFRSDDYWNNLIFMQNMSNMSITYNDQLWSELIREHDEEGNEMLGYFVVQMTQRN